MKPCDLYLGAEELKKPIFVEQWCFNLRKYGVFSVTHGNVRIESSVFFRNAAPEKFFLFHGWAYTHAYTDIAAGLGGHKTRAHSVGRGM